MPNLLGVEYRHCQIVEDQPFLAVVHGQDFMVRVSRIVTNDHKPQVVGSNS